jgi:hypothetical protein
LQVWRGRDERILIKMKELVERLRTFGGMRFGEQFLAGYNPK